MNDQQRHDATIAAYLGEGPRELPLEQRDAIARATAGVAQRRGWVLPWPGTRSNRLAAVLAAVVIAIATALILPRLPGPTVGDPQPTLRWSPAGAKDPFPAPLRIEPSGGAPVVAAELADAGTPDGPDDRRWRHVDPTGDADPGRDPLVDLIAVEFSQSGCWFADSACIRFETASGVSKPLADPLVEWMAYGVVFDNDADGRPDVRFGIDNMPGEILRAWSTNLRAGTTQVVVGSLGTYPDHNPLWEVEFPYAEEPQVNRGYAFVNPRLSSPEGRFYVWSAVIRDGQIVSMDVAPDVGWLDGRPDLTQ